MSEGDQGPSWWFVWLGHSDTNLGMVRFLGTILAYIVIVGLFMATILL